MYYIMIFRLKRFLDCGELQRPQKSGYLVTHVMFWNYIHDVTLLIMQKYEDDDDLEYLINPIQGGPELTIQGGKHLRYIFWPYLLNGSSDLYEIWNLCS